MTFGPVANSSKLKEFGLAIKAERLKKGWSQEELAHQAGLDRSYLGSVERGERNISFLNIMKLAEALGIHPRQFFASL